MDENPQPRRDHLRVDVALDADADDAAIVIDAATSVDDLGRHDERVPTSEERDEAIDALTRAEVVEEDTGDAVRDLMVRAYVRTGGVPARIVSPGTATPPLPDLTSSAAGRAQLDRLDQLVRDAITALNRRESSGTDRESSSETEPDLPPGAGA